MAERANGFYWVRHPSYGWIIGECRKTTGQEPVWKITIVSGYLFEEAFAEIDERRIERQP